MAEVDLGGEGLEDLGGEGLEDLAGEGRGDLEVDLRGCLLRTRRGRRAGLAERSAIASGCNVDVGRGVGGRSAAPTWSPL